MLTAPVGPAGAVAAVQRAARPPAKPPAPPPLVKPPGASAPGAPLVNPVPTSTPQLQAPPPGQMSALGGPLGAANTVHAATTGAPLVNPAPTMTSALTAPKPTPTAPNVDPVAAPGQMATLGTGSPSPSLLGQIKSDPASGMMQATSATDLGGTTSTTHPALTAVQAVRQAAGLPGLTGTSAGPARPPAQPESGPSDTFPGTPGVQPAMPNMPFAAAPPPQAPTPPATPTTAAPPAATPAAALPPPAATPPATPAPGLTPGPALIDPVGSAPSLTMPGSSATPVAGGAAAAPSSQAQSPFTDQQRQAFLSALNTYLSGLGGGGTGAAGFAGVSPADSAPYSTTSFGPGSDLRSTQINPTWNPGYLDAATGQLSGAYVPGVAPIAPTDMTLPYGYMTAATDSFNGAGLNAGPMQQSADTSTARAALMQALGAAMQQPDRTGLAQQQYDQFVAQQRRDEAQQMRLIGQNAAAFGRTGAGMTTNDLTGLDANVNRAISEEGANLAYNTSAQQVSDALNRMSGVGAAGSSLFGQDLSRSNYDLGAQEANASTALQRGSAYAGLGNMGLTLADTLRNNAESDRAYTTGVQGTDANLALQRANAYSGLGTDLFNQQAALRGEMRGERGYQDQSAQQSFLDSLNGFQVGNNANMQQLAMILQAAYGNNPSSSLLAASAAVPTDNGAASLLGQNSFLQQLGALLTRNGGANLASVPNAVAVPSASSLTAGFSPGI